MRLTIVSPFPPAITGIGQYGYHVSKLLEHSGAFSQVTILTGHNGYSHHHFSSNLDIRQGWLPNDWFNRNKIFDSLQRTKPDLVWFNLGVSIFGKAPLANLSGFLSIPQVKRSGLPTVVTLHEIPELTDLNALHAPGGILARYGARLMTHLATRGDVICLTTSRYSNWLSTRYSEGQFVHIPLGAYQSPDPFPESDSSELLMFTTLAPFKGVELLVQSFQKLRQTYPDLRLTIAGAEHTRFPGYMEEIRQVYRHVKGIRWLGQVSENELPYLFKRTQLVILPYLASTGSSSVLWQAAMYGRAIIVSDLDEFRAGVREAGLKVSFCKRNDVHSLSEAIQRMLSSPEERQAQVQANLAASRRLNPEQTCRAYLHAFNLALAVNEESKSIPLKKPPYEAF